MSEKRHQRGRIGRAGSTIKRARLTIPNGFRRRLARIGFAIVKRRVKWFFTSPEVWLIVRRPNARQRVH
jgi:hypothetical protein